MTIIQELFDKGAMPNGLPMVGSRIDMQGLELSIGRMKKGIYNLFSEDDAFEFADWVKKTFPGARVSVQEVGTPDGCYYVGYRLAESE